MSRGGVPEPLVAARGLLQDLLQRAATDPTTAILAVTAFMIPILLVIGFALVAAADTLDECTRTRGPRDKDD
jgi:hypothetical protein